MAFIDSVKKKAGEAYDYVAPKAKAAGRYLQERGHELMESPAEERREHRPRKRTSGRLPRKSQPAGYDGSYDMFGTERRGRATGLPQGSLTGMEMDSDMFGVGNFGMGRPEPREAPRRRRKSRRRPSPRREVEHNLMESDYIPPSMRHMF